LAKKTCFPLTKKAFIDISGCVKLSILALMQQTNKQTNPTLKDKIWV